MGKAFSEWYDFFMSPLEQGRFKRIRRSLLKEADGRVLEIGSGTGVNFAYYQDVNVTAVEPSEEMIHRSLKRKELASVPIDIVHAEAEKLPFADNTFDTIVATLVYCTIPNVDQAMKEMKRVCKPNGKILMFEHVKMNQSLLAKFQEVLTPYWKKICDGCCLDRDTQRLVVHHGFKILQLKEFYQSLFITMVLTNEK